MSSMRGAWWMAGVCVLVGCGGDVADVAGPQPGPTDEGFEGGAEGDGDGDGSACTPTLSALQSDVFASCAVAGCHAAQSPAAALDLSGSDLATRLVGQTSTCNEVPLVIPGDPDGSMLVRKLT